jgi:cation transport regulator ChaB
MNNNPFKQNKNMQSKIRMQSPEKRRSFIRRALRLTRASMKDIAKRAGHKYSAQVVALNRVSGIRDPALARAIAIENSSKKNASKRRRINFFSDSEKADLIERNTPLILKYVRHFWSAREIRNEYLDFKDFLADAKRHIAETLDYYDPERVGKKQKHLKVSTWIGNHANWFCLNKLRSSHQRLKQISVDREGRELEPARSLKPIEHKNASGWELARVPVRARTLLQNLGLDLNDVARIGYGPFRDLITGIALDPETKLTEKERFVILGRLDAKKLEEIGQEFAGRFGKALTKEAIRLLQVKAIAKIKRNWNP